MNQRPRQDIGQNELCQCGSGKKYKRCCGQGPSAHQKVSNPPAPAVNVNAAEQVENAWFHYQQGRLDIAEQILQGILKSRPRNFDALHLLGIVLLKRGQYDQALVHLQKGLKCNLSSPDIHNTLGEVHRLSNRLDQAAHHYRLALKLRPEYPEALLGMAHVLDSQGNQNDAWISIERALKINPNFVEGLCKLGYLLVKQSKLPDALDVYDKVLALNAKLLGPQRDWALVLKSLGRYQEAEDAFRNILMGAPNNAEMHYYLSMVLLAQGKLQEAWEEYEWRWIWDGFPFKNRPFHQPVWTGDDIRERSILVYGEQGIGDEVTFANILPDVVAHARNCIIECEPRLVALFSRSFPAASVVARSDPPDQLTLKADVKSSINSLARWFRPNTQSFPGAVGYLKADPNRTEFWRARLAQSGGRVNIGISWRSMLRNAHRNIHYMEIQQLANLLQVPGVNWINLQYDECSEELDRVKRLYGIEIRQFDDINLMNDLDDVAALMSALDLVISPNTSVSLLAGALGVPVWQFNVKNVNWHPLGTDCWPWFPSMRVYYREWNENWDSVVSLMAKELVPFCESRKLASA